jgi:hypothetical protein
VGVFYSIIHVNIALENLLFPTPPLLSCFYLIIKLNLVKKKKKKKKKKGKKEEEEEEVSSPSE